MTGKHVGAGRKVLRTFSVHAVRPNVDNASDTRMRIAYRTTLREKKKDRVPKLSSQSHPGCPQTDKGP